MGRTGARVAIAAIAAVAVGCASTAARSTTTPTGGRPAARSSTTTASRTSSVPTTTSTPSTTVARSSTTVAPSATTTTPASPATTAPSTPTASSITVATVTAADLGGSWHAGCPVGPAQLRRLSIPYWGFDGEVHRGQLVVNVGAVGAMTTVFTGLYAARFPIRKMVTIDHYAGTGVQLDDESTADDNTAAFNCRNAVNPGGPPSWSEHAYGEAVDVNPVENPYVESDGTVDPPNGAPYVSRSVHRAGMAYPGSPLNDAFAAVGWGWGGYWGANPDYQHFSVNGQ